MRRSAAVPAAGSPARWGRRLGWLLALWAAGVLTLAAAVFVLRALMTWAGLHR